MNIKDTLKTLRNMECEIAEVVALKEGKEPLSYIVYLVNEPSNDDLVKPTLHGYIFTSIDEFGDKFCDESNYSFEVSEFENDF